MNKKLLLLMVAMVWGSAVFGQQYSTVYSGKISYFEDSLHNVKCVRIDSVQYETDSILYPYSTIRNRGYNCYTPAGPLWIGEKVIIKADGRNIFFNEENDTVLIKTGAVLNESWVAYHFPASGTVVATVVAWDNMTFLGLTDSVKTIAFQAYGTDMAPVDNLVNGMVLEISKNYGFVKAMDFYSFPDIYDDNYIWGHENKQYDLIGLSDPAVGVQNLTKLAIYDFQEGDELHIMSTSVDYFYDPHQLTDKVIYQYLSRADHQDSVIYTCARRQSISYQSPDTSYYRFYDDTLTMIYVADSCFDRVFPEEPIYFDGIANYSLMTNGTFLNKDNPVCLRIYLSVVGFLLEYIECRRLFPYGNLYERTWRALL